MSTYEPIASQTLGSAAATVTFSSIPQGYTDLVLVANLISTSSARVKVRVGNGSIDTGSNYSYTILVGNGTSASSGRESSITELNYYWNAIPSGWSNYIIQFQNYSNATTYKTVLGRGNSTAVETFANVGLWRSTSAINIIEIRANTGSFDTGSTFSLYGIQVGQAAQKAQGGNIVVSSGGYIYHAFTSSGSFIPNEALTVDALCIAGGGSGGSQYAGGGGAGGLVEYSSQSLTAKAYPVVIGAGGAAATGGNGATGSNTIFNGNTISGGGGGSWWNSTSNNGQAGGGGGSMGTNNGDSTTGGAALAGGQGSAGGGGYRGSGYFVGGGGGGKGAAGTSATPSVVGTGGIGASYSAWASATSTGDSGYYAGGGGGAVEGGSVALGGTGGGGRGALFGTTTAGTAGLANTGGGGGGAVQVIYPSGAGGSGIVVIRYAI